MAETVDELLVKLGLENDAESFREGERMFGNLRSKALGFGAVVGGVAFGVKKLTDAFAEETDQQGKFARVYGTSAQYVDALGYALERQGGQADEAFESIKRVRDLIEATEWGEIPLEAFRVAGFDPMLLSGVTDVADAYERIADAASRLGPESRRRALSSLGFGDAEIRLLGEGSGSMNDLMGEARRLAPVTDEMVANAEAYTDAQARLDKAIEGIVEILGNKFAPALTDTANQLSSWLSEIREPLGDQVGELIDNTSKEIEFLAGWYENIKREIDMVEEGRGWEVVSDSVARLFSYVGLDDAVARAREREQQKAAERGAGVPGSATNAPSVRSGDSNSTVNYITVDARGSTNPQATANAVEAAVNRALSRAGENAVQKTESPYR